MNNEQQFFSENKDTSNFGQSIIIRLKNTFYLIKAYSVNIMLFGCICISQK